MEKKEGAAATAYREDCWSEGATATLIEAWGDRYVELNRGNLRQKQWQEVADAVNARQTAVKRPHRTDVQCKNRIDTLKKKYKVEKARVTDSDGAVQSHWPFYWRLDMLIGPSVAGSTVKKRSRSTSLSLSSSPPTKNRLPPPPKQKRPVMEHAFLKKGSYSVAAAAAAAAAAAEEEDSESEKSSSGEFGGIGWGERGRTPANGHVKGPDGMKELAEAIAKFGEIYEKVESAKQRQMIELEKQRMEFSKGIEFQRMQMFVDSQVQLAKIKRAKGGGTAASGASDS